MARLRYLQNKRSGTAGTIVKSTSKLHFYDEGMYIYASADGALEIVSDTSITLTAPTVNVEVTASSVFTDPVTIDFDCTASAVSDLTITSSSSSTSGSVNILPLYVDATMSATGGVGRAIEGKLTASGTMGGWGNAIKGYLDVTATNGCTGLISGICAEMRLPSASIQTGTYAVLELNWVGQTNTATLGALTGSHTTLIYANVGGGTATDFDSNGFIFEIEGMSDSTGNAWYDNTLRIAIGDTAWYVPLSSAQGSFTTAYPISVTTAGATAITIGTSATGISMTGTYSAHGIAVGVSGSPLDLVAYDDRLVSIWGSSNATGGNVMPLYVSMATDGACKARAAEFVLTPTAQLGQWANAVKTYLDLSSTSGGSGLVASVCVELKLPATTMTGTITALEIDLVAPTSFVANEGLGSNCVSFINANLSKTQAYGEIDEHGYFLNVQGLTSGSGEMLYNNTLKCVIGSTKMYLPFSTAQSSYTTTQPIVSTNLAAFDATVTMANSADNVIRATVTDSGTRTSGDARGLRVAYTIDSAAALTGTAAAIGCGITFTVSDPCPYIYGYKIYTNTITAKAITQISGLFVYMEDIGNAVEHAACATLNRNITNVGASSDCFLYMRNHGSTAATAFVKIIGSATHLFDFQDGDQCVPVSAGSDSVNVSHKVSVRMADGGTRYLHLFTD